MSSVPPGPNLRGAVDLSALVQRAASPTPSSAAAGEEGAPASPYVHTATDASFNDFIELSARVPVLVEFVATGIEPMLGGIVSSYEGRLVLVVVDAQLNPQLAQAFQLREVPAAAAVLGGSPVSLFVGTPPEPEVRHLIDQILMVAEENGITGRISADGVESAEGRPAATSSEGQPEEEPLPPLHQEAYDAISAGDYARAVEAYQRALRENPRDALAGAGLAQASLLARLAGADAGALRSAAAERPDDVEAQLAVADLDVAGGHLDDAFDRLLGLFPSLDPDGRAAVRTRLLAYFELTGSDNERVAAARRRLASLLY